MGKKVYHVKVNGRWIRLEGEDKTQLDWEAVVAIIIAVFCLSLLITGMFL